MAQASVRGGLITLAGQWSRYALQLVSIVVLARLLSPVDYGVFGMVTVLVSLGAVIRDFGLSSGAIQRDTLTAEQQSTLFYVSTAFGCAVMFAMAGVAVPLAHFYDTPAVRPVTIALSLVPLFGGLAAQFVVDLTRSFRFGDLALADVSSMAVGVAAGISTAAAGGGVWALVALQVSSTLAWLLVLAQRSRFRPGKPAPLREVLPIIKYGCNLLGVQSLDFVSRNLDNVLLGRTWGPATLGLYARAYQLLMLPLQQLNAPLTRVALPVLSRLRHDPPRYRSYLGTATTVVSYAGCTMICACVVLAHEIISLVLGPQWTDSAAIFRALAVAAVLQAVGYVSYWIFLSLDRTHIHLRYSLIAKPLTVLAFFLGLPWQATGVAVAYSVVSAVTVPLGLWMACRGTFVSVRGMLIRVARPLALSAVVGSLSLVLSRYLTDVMTAVSSLLVTAAVLTMVMRLPGYRSDLTELRSAASQARGLRRSPAVV